MAENTIGIKLGYKTSGSTYTNVPHMLEIPDMGGESEKIDITTLDDQVKKSMSGVKDYGDLTFKFLYENKEENDNYRLLKGLAETGETVAWEVLYPDDSKQHFDAIPTVKRLGAGVNARLEFALTLALQSDVTEIDPA